MRRLTQKPSPARNLRHIAVDLIGHGAYISGNGDFSLGANASAIRDLLDALQIDRVHLVGHSYGGGVSLQFTYQFPARVASLVLMSSGGLGADVHFGLRAASLPGSELVLRAAVSRRVVSTLPWTLSTLSKVGLRHRGVSERTLAKLQRLQEESRLTGFVSTVRGVIGPEGQRVQAIDRLAGMSPESVLIIWGDADAMLPVEHGRRRTTSCPAVASWRSSMPVIIPTMTRPIASSWKSSGISPESNQWRSPISP